MPASDISIPSPVSIQPRTTAKSPVKSSSPLSHSLGMHKELDMRLTAYLPAIVRSHLEQQTQTPQLPETHTAQVVSMFADVSGFTAMTESLAARGPVGAEMLSKHLNSYFEQLLRLISSAGGDVFKFAGDAILVFWRENKHDSLQTCLRRCVQTALKVQSYLHEADLAPGVVLSVKMGIGLGAATFAHLGGESDSAINRIECIAVGPALEQAFQSEHQAEPGDVICSSACWNHLRQFVDASAIQASTGNFYKIKSVREAIKICSRRASFTRDDAQLHLRMQQYVPRAVWPYLDAQDEFWGSEIRDVTVLFINLGFGDEDLADMLDVAGVHRLHEAFRRVQACVYEYEGTINKFLVDDKGSTVIAAFGLPPVAHEDDPVRGILASLAIRAALAPLQLRASVGVTTGVAFCGIVGHQGNRREYTILGNIVNLSARLMQKAKTENGGVITDETTERRSSHALLFESRPQIMVKGKNDSVNIHRPYPRMSILVDYLVASKTNVRDRSVAVALPASQSKPKQISNLLEAMHCIQVREAQTKLSRRTQQQTSLDADAIIMSDSFLNVRRALLDKSSRINRYSPGGAFVLEGGAGIGKSVLLRSTLASPEAGGYRVFQATASAFSTRQPYAVWAELVAQAATEESEVPNKRSPRKLKEETEAQRKARVANFMKRQIISGSAPNTTLIQYAHVLSPIFGSDMEDTTGESSSGNQRDTSQAEGELASWFMELLEADLERGRRERSVSDENQDDLDWTPDDLDLRGVLFLCALHAMSRERVTIFCLDNAMHLDAASWTVATIVARYFTNCLVVLGTRPPARALNEHTESSSFGKRLRALRQLHASEHVYLEALCSAEVEDLARELLDVQSVPADLLKLLVSRCQGSPLFLKEVVNDLRNQGVVQVDEQRQTCKLIVQEPWGDKHRAHSCFHCHVPLKTKEKRRCKCCGYVFCEACTPQACRRKIAGGSAHEVRHCCGCYALSATRKPSLEHTTGCSTPTKSKDGKHKHRVLSLFLPHTQVASPDLKHCVALHPPAAVKSILASMLDTLTASQRILMKTASVIGPVFDDEILREACPIKAHANKFSEDLEELERLGMIRPVKREAHAITGLRRKFEFGHGFMQDAVRGQMLCGQVDKLQARVTDAREQHEKQLRMLFSERMNAKKHIALRVDIQMIDSSRSGTSSPEALNATHTSRSPVRTLPTFQRLKSGHVNVRKFRSFFAKLNVKGLANAKMWKRRYAVLQDSRLLLQTEEMSGSQLGRSTALFLHHARVEACDPELAGRDHCFKVEVVEWTKGRFLMSQRRAFYVAVESEAEVENWIYMIRFAIERLENQR